MREFKIGDIVVHKGIQVCIEHINDKKYDCIWVEGNELKRDTFRRTQIVSVEDYNKILQRKLRDRKITDILNDYNKTFTLN